MGGARSGIGGVDVCCKLGGGRTELRCGGLEAGGEFGADSPATPCGVDGDSGQYRYRIGGGRGGDVVVLTSRGQPRNNSLAALHHGSARVRRNRAASCGRATSAMMP